MVDIWCVALDAPADRQDVLSRDEQERASRFVFARDGRRYRVAHASLRRLLSEYVREKPGEIVFEYGRRGKPSLPGVRFNMAHSHELAVIAISSSAEVGVDVEHVRAMPDVAAIAERYFCARERAEIMAAEGEAQVATFMTYWTRKEAILKLTGDGLSLPLDCVDVAWPDGAATQTLRVDDASGVPWLTTVKDLRLADQYAAAVAVEGERCELTYRGTFTA